MVYATMKYQGNEDLFCVDPAGERAFLMSNFFDACPAALDLREVQKRCPFREWKGSRRHEEGGVF